MSPQTMLIEQKAAPDRKFQWSFRPGLIFLVRVPLFGLLFLASFGAIAKFVAPTVLANLFDQGDSFWGVCVVCFCGFLFSAVCLVCINYVRNYGRVRVSDADLCFGDRRAKESHIGNDWVIFGLGALPSFIFAGFIWDGSRQLDLASKLLPTALAFVFAVIAGLLAKLGQLILWDGTESKDEYPPDLVIPLYPLIKDKAFYRSLANLAPARALNARTQPALGFANRCLGPGYCHEDTCEPPKLHWNSGHSYVIAIFVISFVLWWFFGKCKQIDLQAAHASKFIHFLGDLPPLAWVVMFFTIGVMVLAGLAFYLDRYRIPLITVLLPLAFATNFTPKSDHFFAVSRLSKSDMGTYWTPGEILRSRVARGTKRFVVVSTAGGGIQAAAWTAKVLDGLDHDSPQFRNSVLVISSVSGGSVGAMAYARTFDETHPASEYDAVKQAKKPALNAAAWGWTVSDVWRAVDPWTRNSLVDRGWAMERAWTPIFQLKPTNGGELTIGDWALEAHNIMPALIFNASVVETGHPVIFTTSRFADGDVHRGTGAAIYNFHNIYEKQRPYSYDVSVATATRLSSAFPYVAPAARPDLLSPDTPDLHYVDGGYYDNYGITTLFAWLEEAIDQAKCGDCEFLLLRITHFPDAATSTTSHGWLFQSYAPLQGLYDARDAGQLVGDDNQVRLEARLRPHFIGSAIQFQSTDRRCSNPPLSWQLSAAQQSCIDDTWTGGEPGAPNISLRNARRCVADFVSGAKPTACQNLANTGLSPEVRHIQRRTPNE